MKRSILAAAALLVAGTSTAQAQAPSAIRPFTVGVSGGLSVPTGDLAKEQDDADIKSGFNVNGLVGFQAPLMPIGFRGEVNYSRFGLSGPGLADANVSFLGGSANALIGLPSGGAGAAGISPYFIGGVGYEQLKTAGEENGIEYSVKTSGFALNGGVGVKIPLSGFQTFIEARYHYVFSKDDDTGRPNTNYIPISFGIMF